MNYQNNREQKHDKGKKKLQNAQRKYVLNDLILKTVP